MHRKAERLASTAKAILRSGDDGGARLLYAKAADLEEQAFNSVPDDKTRTRSILAVSFAALLYKAQQFEKAEIAIFRLLGSESLLPWAVAQLRELLQVVSDERVLVDVLKTRYSGESITVALRGGEIGAGTGPLDLILDKAGGFRSILYRFAEWIGHYPLRRSGNPPKELMDFIQARVTEPALGSYQLEIRLTEPLQGTLFSAFPLRAVNLSDAIFEFYDRLTVGDPHQIEDIVPQPEYRKALLQLTRNIVPRGKRIKEIGLYRTRNEKLQSIYLTGALVDRVKQVFPKPSELDEHREVVLRGHLRALHLDENWLELTLPKGLHEKCFTLPDMLDDVVGPMVNRQVEVRGHKKRRGKGEHVLVQEIELVDEDE